MSKPSGAVHLVSDSAAGQAPTNNEAAALPNAIERYEHYDHLLDMLSDELAIVHPPHCQRDPVWNARIAELEAQLDGAGLGRARAGTLPEADGKIVAAVRSAALEDLGGHS